MTLRKFIGLILASAVALMVVACSSSSSGPNPPNGPISVTFLNPPPASLSTGASVGLVAIVSNDSAGNGVTWSVTCGGSSCGTISPSSTGSGATATYTAPSALPLPATVTIKAASVTDTTKSVSAAISITSASTGISVSFASQPPSSMVVSTNTSLTAVVTNDSKNAGVTWSVTCGSSQCGSISPTSTASNSPATYTAPAAVPSPATVTVTATSVTDTAKSASETITITATSPTILSDGTYVFHLSGQDNNQSYFLSGAFTVTKGEISAGEQDFSDANLGSTDTLVPSSSSISSTGENLQIVLGTANNQIGVNGFETLRASRVSGTRLLVSEFDSFGAATGSIDLQTSAAAPSGGYAFSVNGIDTNDNDQLAIGGVLNFSGTQLSISNSVFDLNDGGGTTLLGQSFSSGSISAPDSFGRVTIALTPSASGQVPSIAFSGYINGSTIQLIESVGDGLNADLGGTALAQGAKTGTFNAQSVSGQTYIHGSIGQDTNGPLIMGGAFIFASNGTASGLLAFNDLDNNTGNSFSNASYQVSPSGRVVITNVVPSNLSNIALSFVLYLDGNGNAMIMASDNIEQTSGLAYAQNGLSDYEGTYAVAVQGFLNGQQYIQPYGAAGPVTISNDTFNGYTDYTSQNPNLQTLTTPFDTYPSTPLTGLEDTSTGLLHLTGLNSNSFEQPGAFGYYPIDANRVLAIEVDSNGMGLLMLENSSQAQSQQ